MKRILAAAAVALLVGCAGTQFTWDQARQIKQGMSEDQIVALMGKPHTVRSSNGQQVWVWVWVNTLAGSTKTVSVVMVDGKVKEAPEIPKSF